MFEVGRTYRITTSDHEGQSYYNADLIEVELPLIKLERVGNYEILNTHSPCFVSAVPDDEKARADQEAAHRDFMQKINSRMSDEDKGL